MIPYEELDRALARWKAKSQGGVVEAPPIEVIPDSGVEAAPLEVDEAGSIPQPVDPPERTGEIDVADVETYEE